MAYTGKYFKIDDFGGGYCGNYPSSELAPNQAMSLDNIVVLPEGKGFRSRGASTRVNATEFGTANAYPVIGLGVLPITNTNDNVLAVKNGKAYGSSTVLLTRDSATFTDRTGGVTISSGGAASTETTGYKWYFVTFNGKLIGFGGPYTNPDAPFKWAGETNNIAALGGSPPSAAFCFTANNRVFACRTAAAPSTLYWSILANAEDWTGSGSGSTAIGTLGDDTPITGACELSQNLALVFKRGAIYSVSLTAAPFSSQLLFQGVGCGHFSSLIVVDGVAYFIDPSSKQMKATDGSQVFSFPLTAGDLFSSYSATHYTTVARETGTDYDWIIWSMANVPQAVVWDLRNKCWLYHSKGYNFSSAAHLSTGPLIYGYYNVGRVGIISTDLSTDDFDGSASVVSKWRSGWMNPGNFDTPVRPTRLVLNADALASTTLTISYGFDFTADSRSATFSLTPDSGDAQVLRRAFITGRGNVFQYYITGSPSAQGDLKIFSLSIGGHSTAQKTTLAS